MRWILLALLAACGPKTNPVDPDGPVEVPEDAPPDSPPITGCDYDEIRDTTNDDVPPATGTPEDTGVTLDQKLVICGSFAEDHFDGDITVDVDGYVVELAQPADILVRISGAGAENIELVGVDVYAGVGFTDFKGSATFYGDHGVSSISLGAGRYSLSAFALAGKAIAAKVNYKLEISIDDPATRCPAVTTGGYLEANDGGSNTSNDMVTIPSGSPPALTASAADSPESSGQTIGGTTNTRVSGTSANVNVTDQYEDKDTYLITTDDANELTVRLDWTAAANLDFLLFEAGSPDPVKRAIGEGNIAPELATFSVKPGQNYWLLVGTKVGGSLPATYNATLCGGAYVP